MCCARTSFARSACGTFPGAAEAFTGPYGKGLAFQDGRASAWARMVGGLSGARPRARRTCTKAVGGAPIPEKWVPGRLRDHRGWTQRGAGRSPGFLDPWSPRVGRRIFAAASNGLRARIGATARSGSTVSPIMPMNAWYAAARKPPHLAAICVWEGAADYYREVCRHGGIYSQFLENLYPRALLRVQHGLGSNGLRSQVTGELVSGPETLSREELAANSDRRRPLDIGSSARRSGLSRRSPDWARVEIHCSARPIGAGRGCTPAGISRASCTAHRRTNGWRCTAKRIGSTSIPTMESICRSAFSATF